MLPACWSGIPGFTPLNSTRKLLGQNSKRISLIIPFQITVLDSVGCSLFPTHFSLFQAAGPFGVTAASWLRYDRIAEGHCVERKNMLSLSYIHCLWVHAFSPHPFSAHSNHSYIYICVYINIYMYSNAVYSRVVSMQSFFQVNCGVWVAAGGPLKKVCCNSKQCSLPGNNSHAVTYGKGHSHNNVSEVVRATSRKMQEVSKFWRTVGAKRALFGAQQSCHSRGWRKHIWQL